MVHDQKIVLRNLVMEDYDDLVAVMRKAYRTIGGQPWKKNQIESLLVKFPEGQLGIEVNGTIVACALSLIVDYKKFGDDHSYEQITDNYRFNTHNPNGDVLYGIDVFVDPDYRGMRLGRRLYDARKELCENLGLRSIVAGGRMPGYAEHAAEMTPKQYIQKVRNRELYDPILTFQLANDFHVKKFLSNYLSFDSESKGYATLIEWNNIYYETEESLINTPKADVRIGLVQWQMRTVSSLEGLMENVEFFVDVVSDYECDFILFPEFFNAPLMAQFNDKHESEAIRLLAEYTEPLRNRFIDLAVSYNVNIISGSMPYINGDKLLNVGYLCRRDGSWESFSKIHITPSEAYAWGMVGGDKVRVFDTDAGKIGILICYDSEFPELARLLAMEGMQILFVPFLTDTQNGYNRVRHCAQARAIENECYVAIAGCVGNLPRVQHMDIQYAQSGVFSPCDFAFPLNGVVTEATPNTEMTLIADVNLDLLKELHFNGSVHNLMDRRTDLYHLDWKAGIS
ncbi:MAG: bifunctional GNAT family N-acetyltransferase/carbon-nitrogen hydrolase family protein [Candidatus Sericytochromatia bacterium]|nr:bifunctional GNAT family N-acetyltransferase/carbon-nitrogen hydrolase family protein [Candidatus Sericytochromatia bacterium]